MQRCGDFEVSLDKTVNPAAVEIRGPSHLPSVSFNQTWALPSVCGTGSWFLHSIAVPCLASCVSCKVRGLIRAGAVQNQRHGSSWDSLGKQSSADHQAHRRESLGDGAEPCTSSLFCCHFSGVCICVCVHVCAHVCMHVYDVCMCVCACVYACVYICVCVCVHAHACAGTQSLREGIRSLGDGVPCGCERPDTGAENQTLWKICGCS